MPATAKVKAEKKPKKVKLHQKSLWSEALHTALRKCCDSTPTTIAWNLICVLEGPAWADYTKVIQDNVPDFYENMDLGEALKRASKKWDCYAYAGDERHVAIALKCAFELFEDRDWEGFAEFLKPL